WPKEDRERDGRTALGFKSLLTRMHKLHKDSPKELAEQAEAVAKRTQTALAGLNRGVALIELNRELVEAYTDSLKEEFDKLHGGFGSAERAFRGPKFPLPSTLVLLQNEHLRTNGK